MKGERRLMVISSEQSSMTMFNTSKVERDNNHATDSLNKQAPNVKQEHNTTAWSLYASTTGAYNCHPQVPVADADKPTRLPCHHASRPLAHVHPWRAGYRQSIC